MPRRPRSATSATASSGSASGCPDARTRSTPRSAWSRSTRRPRFETRLSYGPRALTRPGDGLAAAASTTRRARGTRSGSPPAPACSPDRGAAVEVPERRGQPDAPRGAARASTARAIAASSSRPGSRRRTRRRPTRGAVRRARPRSSDSGSPPRPGGSARRRLLVARACCSPRAARRSRRGAPPARHLFRSLREPAEQRPPVRKPGRLVTQRLLRELARSGSRASSSVRRARCSGRATVRPGRRGRAPGGRSATRAGARRPPRRARRARRAARRPPPTRASRCRRTGPSSAASAAAREAISTAPGGREVGREGHLARDEHETEVGPARRIIAAGRGVEQLDVRQPGRARPPRGRRACRSRPRAGRPFRPSPVSSTDAEDGARVVARTPQRPGRGGAHLDGLGEPDVERAPRECLADAVTTHSSASASSRPGRAARTRRCPIGAAKPDGTTCDRRPRPAAAGAIADLVTVPVVDVLHVVEVDEHDPAGPGLRAEARLERGQAEHAGTDSEPRARPDGGQPRCRTMPRRRALSPTLALIVSSRRRSRASPIRGIRAAVGGPTGELAVTDLSGGAGVRVLQVLVDEGDRHAPLADRGGDALHRREPHVAAGEDARDARLEQVRVAFQRPPPCCAHVRRP